MEREKKAWIYTPNFEVPTNKNYNPFSFIWTCMEKQMGGIYHTKAATTD